jgi:type IV pilus assembly protein PilC
MENEPQNQTAAPQNVPQSSAQPEQQSPNISSEPEQNKEMIHIGKAQKQTVAPGSALELNEDADANLMDKINMWIIDHSGVKTKERVTLFRLLATMINAGLSLVKALYILSEQAENPKIKRVCDHLRHTVENGRSLSEGMHKYPDVFEDAQIGMLRSGEVTGKLNEVLLQVADQMEASAKIKGKIKGAMMYPIAIVFVLVAVVGAVTVMVIPKLKSMFEAGGAELPKSTQMLIVLSDFLTASWFFLPNWLMCILGAFGFFTALGKWKRTKSGKYYWDIFLFSVPIFGNLARKVVLARFCRSVSTLLRSGISITKALDITGDVVGSEVYRRRITLITEDVSQGITIAENIKGQKKMWPIMLVSMIGVGEQTAQLDGVSGKLAEFYEDEVDNIVKNLSSLMEPIIILLIGVVVGFLVAAIMGPIMKMSEVATA